MNASILLRHRLDLELTAIAGAVDAWDTALEGAGEAADGRVRREVLVLHEWLIDLAHRAKEVNE